METISTDIKSYQLETNDGAADFSDPLQKGQQVRMKQ